MVFKILPRASSNSFCPKKIRILNLRSPWLFLDHSLTIAKSLQKTNFANVQIFFHNLVGLALKRILNGHNVYGRAKMSALEQKYTFCTVFRTFLHEGICWWYSKFSPKHPLSLSAEKKSEFWTQGVLDYSLTIPWPLQNPCKKPISQMCNFFFIIRSGSLWKEFWMVTTHTVEQKWAH